QTLFNPNAVKVVTDHQGFALYFSRAPMPWNRAAFADGRPEKLPEGVLFRRHIGLYAYKVGFLHDYVRWPASPLETCESLEQLRALVCGCGIHVADAGQVPPGGGDTPEALERVRQLLAAGCWVSNAFAVPVWHRSVRLA